jgi:OPT family oligopeptide transporter
MTFISFDWTQIAWISSPLMVPWWAQLHTFGSFVFFYWICVPALYYSNTWQFAHFPLGSSLPFDNTGHYYNVSRVVTANQRFNEAAFNDYSPLYLTATFAMTYMLSFALATAVLVHTVLYHGRSLLNGLKRVRVEKDDIHAKLMRNYPEVPDWWYIVAFTLFFSLAIIACEVWHTGVPVWALLIALLLPVIYILPSGFIFAMTGQSVSRLMHNMRCVY